MALNRVTDARVQIGYRHHQRSDWLLLRRIAEAAVESTCRGISLPDIEINSAGMFVCGGPNGDNGLSGKKLVVDAYGPSVPIGGVAWSGKDFFKVDRLGGMLASRFAVEALHASDADEAQVTLIYLPGGDRPASVDLLLDGAPSYGLVVPKEFRSLETKRVHEIFAAADVALIELARWGLQRAGVAWEGGMKCPAHPASPELPLLYSAAKQKRVP